MAERVGTLQRDLALKEAEATEARREAAQQASVLGKQQSQLEALAAEAQREREVRLLVSAFECF